MKHFVPDTATQQTLRGYSIARADSGAVVAIAHTRVVADIIRKALDAAHRESEAANGQR